MTPPVLKSSRLLLRDFTSQDWRDVHDYASRPEACLFQPWGPNTPDESRAYVERMIALAREQPRTEFHLAAVLAEKGTVIGTGGLAIRRQYTRTAEISYIIHPTYWGQGLATELAQTLLNFGFTALNMHRIFATCDPRNTASERVMQKLGMSYEGRMRETLLIRDGWRDSLLYGLLEQEWRSAQPA